MRALGALAVACVVVACGASTPSEPSSPSALDASSDAPAIDGAIASDAGSDAPADTTTSDAEPPLTPSADCLKYCDDLMTHCTGVNQQFSTKKQCLRACTFYPLGNPGDATGNSLTCRIRHTIAAESDQAHCHHAGPFGYSGCGEPCDILCTIAMGWCGTRPGGAPYASQSACLAECAAFVNEPGPTAMGVAYNASGPATGDSIDCREYHLVRALESAADRDASCPKAATNSPACR